MQQRIREIEQKITIMRSWLLATGAGVLRLRGTDWFACATAGGSNTVLLTGETGVAEVAVSATEAYILTDQIEAKRRRDEEARCCCQWHAMAWGEPEAREASGGRRPGGA